MFCLSAVNLFMFSRSRVINSNVKFNISLLRNFGFFSGKWRNDFHFLGDFFYFFFWRLVRSARLQSSSFYQIAIYLLYLLLLLLLYPFQRSISNNIIFYKMNFYALTLARLFFIKILSRGLWKKNFWRITHLHACM